MEMEKKNLAIIILAVVLAVSGIGNVILAIMTGLVEVVPPPEKTIIYGTMYGPVDADPQYMWDSASFDYAYQVWEPLFTYDLADPAVPMIPRLAVDFGTWSGANYTVTLQQGISFHSGAPFNAEAVKFTFDRLNYLCNFSGDQPSSGTGSTLYGESIISVLYMWPNGTAVIKDVEVVSEYVVKFVLTYPYGVFLPLLTFTASMILDPSITPAKDYICLGMAGATSETISGTGPWKFTFHRAGVMVRFVRNDDYWRGAGKVENLRFSVIQNSDARNTALLAQDINFLADPHPSYYSTISADSELTLYEAGPGTITQYLGFNNKVWNITQRAAMSYAINYTYMIDELLEGEAVRLRSPIPLGIQFANWSYDVPDLNITKARQYMVSMGYGGAFTTDAQWIAQATSAPFWTCNFTYNLGNKFREDMSILLQNNFKMIGVKVLDNGLEWTPYLDLLYNRIPHGWDKLSIWFIGWMPDYNDPSNYVNSLMSNVSSSNSAQINDKELEAYMLAGLLETDQAQREHIYWDLQKYVVEELRPWAFGYVGRNHDAYVSTLKGFPSNGMGYVYFYPCYFD